MRITVLPLVFLLSSCHPTEREAPVSSRRETRVAPVDETRRFPKANLAGSRVAATVLGKDFLPGGTVAEYRRGSREWTLFVVKTASASAAAIALIDWKKALSDPELVPSFGGYFGSEGGKPTFVFTKNAWVAGVVGLNKNEADAQARALAARLD